MRPRLTPRLIPLVGMPQKEQGATPRKNRAFTAKIRQSPTEKKTPINKALNAQHKAHKLNRHRVLEHPVKERRRRTPTGFELPRTVGPHSFLKESGRTRPFPDFNKKVEHRSGKRSNVQFIFGRYYGALLLNNIRPIQLIVRLFRTRRGSLYVTTCFNG